MSIEDMSQDLLPCPMCGKSLAIVSNIKAGVEWWSVDCDAEAQDGCGLSIQRSTRAAAIAAWNTRAALALPAPVIEREDGVTTDRLVEIANEAVTRNLDENDQPRYGSAQGYACAYAAAEIALREQSPTPSVRARALEEAGAWRNRAFETAAEIVDRYVTAGICDAQAAKDIRALAEGEG